MNERVLFGIVVYNYSDTYMEDVAYTDRDNAIAHARAIGGDVQELRIDPPLREDYRRYLRPGLRYFSVRMRFDGQGAAVTEDFPKDEEPPLREIASELLNTFITECWATDEEHAIKIANERRTGWLVGGQRLGQTVQYTWRRVIR